MTLATYFFEENGLSFLVEIGGTDGALTATVHMCEGSADINAFYWGDAIDDGSSFAFSGKLNPLNMKGTTEDWDGGTVLSMPGLAGADKETYLQAGEAMMFDLPEGLTLDDLAVVGVRATSTSTPEGSIKSIGVAITEDDPTIQTEPPEVASTEDLPAEDATTDDAPVEDVPAEDVAIASETADGDTAPDDAPAEDDPASGETAEGEATTEPTGEETASAGGTTEGEAGSDVPPAEEPQDDAAWLEDLSAGYEEPFDDPDFEEEIDDSPEFIS